MNDDLEFKFFIDDGVIVIYTWYVFQRYDLIFNIFYREKTRLFI